MPKKKTPTVIVPARTLKVGQFVVCNSGDIKEVTPAIKRALPPHAGVKTYSL